MYLISVEGGDGSGKGEAARIIGELLTSFLSQKFTQPMNHADTVNSVNSL